MTRGTRAALSNTVRCSSRRSSANTSPIRRRSLATSFRPSVAASRPNSHTCPAAGRSARPIRLRMAVFPQPAGPARTRKPPGAMAKESGGAPSGSPRNPTSSKRTTGATGAQAPRAASGVAMEFMDIGTEIGDLDQDVVSTLRFAPFNDTDLPALRHPLFHRRRPDRDGWTNGAVRGLPRKLDRPAGAGIGGRRDDESVTDAGQGLAVVRRRTRQAEASARVEIHPFTLERGYRPGVRPLGLSGVRVQDADRPVLARIGLGFDPSARRSGSKKITNF